LTNQILALKTTLNDIEDELKNTNDAIQNINSSVSANFRSVNEDLININVSIDDLQDSISAYKTQIQSQISLLSSSITNNVNLLQHQIDDMKIEWRSIGMWTDTKSIRTTTFTAKNELRIQLWMDGITWESFVCINIYYNNGTFYHSVVVSGYYASDFAAVPIESGEYYFDITAYNVNLFIINVWTYK
jgi:hypothetical protein